MNKLTLTQKNFKPYKGFKADMKELETRAKAASATATWLIEDDTLIIEATSIEPLDYLADGLKEELGLDAAEVEIVLEQCDAQTAT